jgi:hypothetical protein
VLEKKGWLTLSDLQQHESGSKRFSEEKTTIS